MRDQFEMLGAEAILLVDAENAFQTLNRRATLHNARYLCPNFAVALSNIYRSPSRQFGVRGLNDFFEISSQEGTTQGCPFAMLMYALGTIPLIQKLDRLDDWNDDNLPAPKQGWYADDSQAVGSLDSLEVYLERLTTLGRPYGYHVGESKTVLIVKPDLLDQARRQFADKRVQVVTGAKDLGSYIGEDKEEFIRTKVTELLGELNTLTTIASTQPHAALAAFTHAWKHKLTYLARTTPRISEFLQPLEDAIKDELIPALFAVEATDALPPNLRDILALPPKLGGLGLTNPVKMAPRFHQSHTGHSSPNGERL